VPKSGPLGSVWGALSNERPYRERFTPPRWQGRDSLDLAYQLNERCLKLLRDVAGTPDGGNWPLIAHDPTLWSTLDAQTIERAARFPFVILDVHFTGVEWWREVIDGSAVPAAPHTWPANVSEQLMSETLVFAWHTAKWDRRVARLSLGVLPAVAELIAALTPQQLATISGKHRSALRLRWHGDPDFWAQLLNVARDDDEEGLAEIHLHAKLLLLGELIAQSSLALSGHESVRRVAQLPYRVKTDRRREILIKSFICFDV
jgi:hypothetical protein